MNKLGYKIIPIDPVLVNRMKKFVLDKISNHNSDLIFNDEYFAKHFSDKIKRSYSLDIEHLANREAYRIASEYFGMSGAIPFVDRQFMKKCGYPKLDLFFRLVRKNKEKDIGFPHTDKSFWDIAKKNKNTPIFSKCKLRVKVWIPIYGCDKNNSLIVYEGSHLKKNYSTLKKKNNQNIFRPEIKKKLEKYKYKVPVYCKHNNYSALLFDDNLIHSGQINNSTKYRISSEFHIIME
jgi:hypothetical protein